VSAKREVSLANTEDARMKALEEQLRTLAGEVALLRSELKELRQSKSPEQSSGPQVLLASAHPEPGMLPSTPAPAGRTDHANTDFGGASGNAKLLNPDIALIGDFIGTVGHNNVSPGPSLDSHESEIGLQAIIDPYSRADGSSLSARNRRKRGRGLHHLHVSPAGLLLKVGKKRADFGGLYEVKGLNGVEDECRHPQRDAAHLNRIAGLAGKYPFIALSKLLLGPGLEGIGLFKSAMVNVDRFPVRADSWLLTKGLARVVHDRPGPPAGETKLSP